MTIQSATPYLILNGRARAAIELYQNALAARVEELKRFGDVDRSCPAARRDLVMHAELRAGGAVILLSDGPAEGPLPQGGNVNVALRLDDPAQARSAFDALATSGKVIEPLFAAPWGGLFGVVADRFGVGWMFNCTNV